MEIEDLKKKIQNLEEENKSLQNEIKNWYDKLEDSDNERVRLEGKVKEGFRAGRNFERSDGITDDWKEFAAKNNIKP